MPGVPPPTPLPTNAVYLIYYLLATIGNLPPELIWAILYTHGGLVHPNAISIHSLANSFLIRDLANGHAHRRRIVPPHPVVHHPHLGAAPASPLSPAALTHHEYETHCICAHSMFALGHPQIRPITTLGQTTLIRHCHRTPPYTRLAFLPYPRSCSLARLLRVMISNLDRPPSTPNAPPHNHRDAWRPLASLSASVFGGPTGNNRLLPLTYRDSRDASRRLICHRLGFHPGDPEHSYLWSLRIPRAVLIRTYYKLPDDAPHGGPASVFHHRPAKVRALSVLLQTIDAANTCWAPPPPPSPHPPVSATATPPSPLPSVFPAPTPLHQHLRGD